MINIKEQLSESELFNKLSEGQQDSIITTIKEASTSMHIDLKTVKVINPFTQQICTPTIMVCINNEINLNTGIMIEDIC